MTPGEHIAEAERLLTLAYPLGDTYPAPGDPVLVQGATAHALIAVAVELGAPHPAAPAGGEQGAQASPAS